MKIWPTSAALTLITYRNINCSMTMILTSGGRTNRRQEDDRTSGRGKAPMDLEVKEELRSIRSAAIMNDC